ncbi:DNA alkylation repair protein [Planctomycetota bacterium]
MPSVVEIQALSSEIGERIRGLADRSVAPLRMVRKEYTKRVKAWSGPQVISLAQALLDEPGVDRFVADELIACHEEAPKLLDDRLLEQLAHGMASWGEVDCFGCLLSGPAWREGQISDETIHGWARSDDRWWRRAALVSTVPLNMRSRGGRGNTKRTLAACRLLLDDRDDMVVKAMSWALRALIVHDRRAVERFLQQHELRLAARVLREVRNKLATGKKNPTR